jgi:hypothetical protein
MLLVPLSRCWLANLERGEFSYGRRREGRRVSHGARVMHLSVRVAPKYWSATACAACAVESEQPYRCKSVVFRIRSLDSEGRLGSG